jgi:hypothetical protein
MTHSKLQKKHFTVLKEKYQVSQDKHAETSSFLYLILRKAELGIQITEQEFQWLAENRFTKTVDIIALQQYQAEEKQRLGAELLQLRNRYRVPEDLEISIASPVYSILWKAESGFAITATEFEILKSRNLVDTITLVQEALNFSRLKVEYKATRHTSCFPEEPLYSILKKLDTKEQLADAEADWLLHKDFNETLEIHWQQENERKAELEFLMLKSKYQVASYSDISISSPLYLILKKLDSGEELFNRECKWLKHQQLNELILIDQDHKDRNLFAKLKEKYQATQFQCSNPSSRLFLILKNLETTDSETFLKNGDFQRIEKDIEWLSEQGLTETVEIVRNAHFKALKNKYQIVGKLAIEPFYEIMLKLEREERLDPKQVVQLIEEDRLSRNGKIAIAYYRLEAIFYEKEYQRTGNKWNLPSASSNWRKADEPAKALKVTDDVNWNKVKDPDLKSALLVTRAAAFRDLGQLKEAENCAMQAMECQPNNHQPYTLMGAICYDQCNYAKGDYWFEMATERGADDTDGEIERIVRMTKQKDKQREVAEYLLSKDPQRYKWARSYLKQK